MKAFRRKQAVLCCVIAAALLLLAACGGAGGKYTGTWTPEKAEYNGSVFTVAELEAAGDYSISNIYLVIKDGGSAYVSENGNGAVIEWRQAAGGIQLGEMKCPFRDGYIVFENNGGSISLAKRSDSQEITTATENSAQQGDSSPTETTAPKENNTQAADSTAETESEPEAAASTAAPAESAAQETGTAAQTAEAADEALDLDPGLVLILDDIESHFTAAADECMNSADRIINTIGDSYEAYKSNKDGVSGYYADCISTADELYAYVKERSIAYYKAVADLKMDYSGWDAALDAFYDKWDSAMDEYYDKWDRVFDDVYDIMDDVIDSASDDIEYSEYSSAWSELYGIYSDSWSSMYSAYSDNWSDIYSDYSDVWSGFFSDNFDVDDILK